MATMCRHLVTVILGFLAACCLAQETLFPGGALPVVPNGISGCGDTKIDLVIVLDSAASPVDFQALRQFAADVAEFASVDTGNVRIAMLGASSKAKFRFPFGRHNTLNAVQRAILSAPQEGGRRDFSKSFSQAQRLLRSARGDADKFILLLTSGNSQVKARRTAALAKSLKSNGVKIVAVGVGVQNEREINDIVVKPVDDNKFLINDIADLSFMSDVVFSTLCGKGDLSGGVSGSISGNQLDLVFLLHFSQKIQRNSFRQIQDFLKATINRADIDSGNVRVGAAMYKSDAFTIFNLNQYASKQDVMNSIDKINYNYRDHQANSAAGLNLVRREMFTAASGDRPSVPNMVIVVTDSNTNVDVGDTIQAAQDLQNSGALVYALGIDLEYAEELEAISSGVNYYELENTGELPSARDEIVEQVQPLREGGPAVTVNPEDIPGADEPLSLANSGEADVAIVYQISKLAKPKDIRKALVPFMRSLFANADIDGGDVRVALVNYGRKVTVQFKLNQFSNKRQVMNAISKNVSPRLRLPKANGGAALSELQSQVFTQANGDRPDVPNAVVLITDTKTNVNPAAFIQEAAKLKNAGVKIYTIGIGKADRGELGNVASDPASSYSSYVPRFANLDNNIKNAVGNVVNALSSNPRKPPTKPAPVVTTPRPVPKINLPTRPRTDCGDTKMDLVFVLDASTSVTKPNFQLMLDFLKYFLVPANIDDDNVRVGIVIYSTKVFIQFQMNEFIGNKRGVYQAIDNIPYEYGSTNTYGGLNTMRTQMFTPGTGDRPDVDNVCILITDGVSNINARRTIPEAEEARNQGIHIYVIGIGLQDTKEIDGIASRPIEENRFTVQEFSELQSMRDAVFNSLRKGCPTLPPPTLPPKEVPNHLQISKENGYDW